MGPRGAAACSLCLHPGQGSSLSVSVWMDRLQRFLCSRVLPEKVGRCLLPHQEVCLGSLFSWLLVGGVGCRRRASCVSCVPAPTAGPESVSWRRQGFLTQVSTPEDLQLWQLETPLQHPQPLTVFCPGQICVPVESSSPLVMSNQKEVLRCFTVLGMQAEPLVSSGCSPP